MIFCRINNYGENNFFDLNEETWSLLHRVSNFANKILIELSNREDIEQSEKKSYEIKRFAMLIEFLNECLIRIKCKKHWKSSAHGIDCRL